MIIDDYKSEYANGIIDLMQQFHEKSLYAYGSEFCRESATKTLQTMVDNPICKFFVLVFNDNVVGVLSGFVTPCVWNYSHKEFIETAWYMDESYRGHGLMLYKKMIAFCKREGIKYIKMGFMENSLPDKLEQFFKTHGFFVLEKSFVKITR
jgi:GNAT superfamily N-acetyltransferase